MIIFKDFLNDIEVASDALPSTILAGGAVVAYESKKVAKGGEAINIGANASKEETEEALDDSVQQVINIVDSHGLQSVKLEKKEYITLQNAYWKKLVTAITAKKNSLVFGKDESKWPANTTAAEKEEFKKAEAAAIAKVKDVLLKQKIEECTARLDAYKKHFADLQKFVKDEVLANFSEFDFFIAAEPNTIAEPCMIIPARYIGEAVAPTFYFYVDGLYGEKA
jgi:hypothetical protein